jgi:sigma-E factor negative regulatory protein RseA
MANKLHESLSALMDNESDELELRRILKAMEATESSEPLSENADLAGKWHRYHVLSASLQREIHTSPSRNLLAGIQAELAQDAAPTRSLVTSLHHKGIFRMIGQGAIAASIAVAVLFTADLALDANSTSPGAQSPQVADNAIDQLPGFTGDLNPSTNTRVAVQSALNAEEMSRLERMVSAELEDVLETPATFDPDKNR